ncbi:MAG: tetratricopeptide repeat protein [Chloroflexi bacterium]|nr:tetratricopeptide repeat protein [Chloroflexota bacterium]
MTSAIPAMPVGVEVVAEIGAVEVACAEISYEVQIAAQHMDAKATPSVSGQLIDQTCDRLALAGQWSEIARFLEDLRKVGNGDAPEWKVWQAEVDLRLGNPHKSVALANQLLAPPCLPMHFRVKALLIRSSAARLRGFLGSAEEDARAALKAMENDSQFSELRMESHRQLGAVLGTLGRLDESVQEFEKGLQLCAKSSDLAPMAMLEDNLAIVLAQLGQLPQALMYFERAKAAYKKMGDDTNLARVLNNIGRLYYDLGQNDSALEALREGKAAAGASKSIRIEGSILVNMGDTLQGMSLCDDAMQCYREAMGIAEQVLEPRLFCQANIGIGTTYCASGDFEKARIFLRKAEYEARKVGLDFELSVALLHLGVVYMKGGNYKESTDYFTNAITKLQSIGAKRELLKGYVYLALLHLKTRRWARLRKCLEFVGKIVRELDLEEQLLLEVKELPEIVEYAASKRICGLLFQEIRSRLQARTRNFVAEVPLSRIQTEGASSWPLVEVHSLGESLVLLDNRRINETEWRSQKAKEMFFYLLCHRRGATREQLLDVLWPDIAVPLSRNALYNNVYRLRKAVYEGIITQDEGRYKVNPESPLCFDLESYQSLIDRANKLPSGSRQRAECLEQAIHLYRGSFLEEFYAEWCDAIRFQAEALYLQSLARLAGFYAASGQYDLATEALEKLLALDETNPTIHEQIIKVLIKKGESVAAHRHYVRYQAIMKEDLNQHFVKSFAQLVQEESIAR